MARAGKIILAVLAILAAVALALFIFAYSFLNGNPFTRHSIESKAAAYIEQTYPGTDYVIDGTYRDIKMGGYGVAISSPSSEDTYFTLHYESDGTLRYDDYPNEVGNRFTVYRRIEEEYRKLTDPILQNISTDPSKIAFGEIPISEKSAIGVDPSVPECAYPMEDLELDRRYDLKEMGAHCGNLILYMESPHPSLEEAGETLLQLRKDMDAAGVKFRTVELAIREPLETRKEANSINLYFFPYEQIKPEGLEENLKRVQAETKEYLASIAK